MNGPVPPDGDKHAGYWQITAVDEPTSFSFVDGFADLDFNPDPGLPVSRNVYTFAEHDGGTRATLREHLRVRRGASAGARHGRGRGRLIGDQPDRRPGCLLNRAAGGPSRTSHSMNLGTDRATTDETWCVGPVSDQKSTPRERATMQLTTSMFVAVEIAHTRR